mmetsp:Transcript_87932/g.188613  ORF Transcript_87932/g.188613 Transcript_87932/m.188613 type:complete len:544 (-) Transcript_87932:240-1871(-)
MDLSRAGALLGLGSRASLYTEAAVEEGDSGDGSTGDTAFRNAAPKWRWQQAAVFVGALATLACGAALCLERLLPHAGGVAPRVRGGSRAPTVLLAEAGAGSSEDIIDEFRDLGTGNCVNFTGAKAEQVEWLLIPAYRVAMPTLPPPSDQPLSLPPPTPSAPETITAKEWCIDQCRFRKQACTGFTLQSDEKCGLLTNPDFRPSAADGDDGKTCFWRKTFLLNTKGLYSGHQPAIPKIIWSYWINMPGKNDSDRTKDTIPQFIDICTASWKKLNPGYKVHVLNDTTMWEFVNRSELPKQFDQLMIQHKSDAIRLALLARHGGIWIDASTILVKPLEQILGSNPSDERTFFELNGQPTRHVNAMDYEKRVDWKYHHIENWFFASPPGDPLFVRTHQCVNKILETGHDTKLLNSTGLFSKTQLENFYALDIWAWLSTHACMFKVIDDDLAMTHWWTGPNVHHRDPLQGVIMWFTYDWSTMSHMLFKEVNNELLDELMNKSSAVLKFGTDTRKFLVSPITPKQMWCKKSTFHVMLSELGLLDHSKCW